VALGSLLPAAVAGAAGPDDANGEARRTAEQLTAAVTAIRSASANLDRLRAAPAAAVPVDQVRADLALAQAGFGLREAFRQEQRLVYTLAGRQDLERATLPLLAGPDAAGLSKADEGLRALWRLSGLDPGATMRPRHNKRFADAEPLEALLGYYRTSAGRTGIDWTYLAAINFIESDFGRTNGPSSAGALGPMQFLPATFRQYGGDGDIMRPRDAIQAAALMLARNGAPGDYGRALLRYNQSQDYVAAVTAYAAAIRADTLWLTRFYYWSTYG
jgi:membrane-bound lytic murein transglycosylase B